MENGIKIINESLEFSTSGEIDFIDLSDKVQEVVSKYGIKKWFGSCIRTPCNRNFNLD
jgi:thiamine phosphate synthase YjbQ (UPF0047 family)